MNCYPVVFFILELLQKDKGRYAWNSEAKTWEIKFRPFYEQWIALLRLVNPLIYAPQPKMVIPKKIKAQFETALPNGPVMSTKNYRKSTTDVSEIPLPILSPKEKCEVFYSGNM